MKFFHLSDLHLGLRLFTRDLREDQEYILNRIVEAAAKEQPDAVVIAGDIYDKAVPSAESVKLFDSFLTGLTKAAPEAVIMMISGNHDSAVRVLQEMAGGDRLIGIISHVSELKQAIEDQLLVTRDEHGSNAVWQLS